MKLGPVTKLDHDVMLENFDVIVIFTIHGQFGAIWQPDTGRIICKSCVFITTNLLS